MIKKQLSETVDRKYIDSVSADDYEVWTDDGWVSIQSVNKTVEYDVWDVNTENHNLKCADMHIVFDEDLSEVFVKDLKNGDAIVTEDGAEKILSVNKTSKKDNMYDLTLVDNSKHRFFTNGILSHNSTIYCIYSLWLTTFFPEKKVMILANKLSTALELLGRVQTGYEYLPRWLKCGCTVINKGELTFSNMSSIRAFSSSSDAARGFSANCVHKNTKVTIRLFGCNRLVFSIKISTLKKISDFINALMIWRKN